MTAPDPLRAALRWRLVLGRHAEAPLPLEPPGGDEGADGAGPGEGAGPGGGEDGREEARARDVLLSYLYDREHAARGHQRASASGVGGLAIPAWLAGVRALFPVDAAEILERDALVRYGLTELVTDPKVLRSLEPSVELVGVLLGLRDRLAPEVRVEARRMITRVVAALAAKLRGAAESTLLGPRDRERLPPVRTFRNVDWAQTVRRNLVRWDPAERRLGVDRVRWKHNQRRRASTRVVLAVDQSGSMVDSLIHASVTAAILASLPAVSVHLVLWDDRVVDLSAHVHDPLEVLMAAQLGGGTQLLPALSYCADLVTEPERTVLAVISDFHVFDPHEPIVALAGEIAAEGVRCFGFCAVTEDGRGAYDERLARQLAAAGWWVGAVTPNTLVEHVGPLLG